MHRINRRDFLKLMGVSLGATAFSRFDFFSNGQAKQKPNIIILVFDAMSAAHLSIYGYPRNTTPNFERLAQRATVYHSNYAAANFTSPGTATILTGLYPWKHRAFDLGGLVRRELADNNLFKLLGDDYYSVGFAQNVWANNLLSEFKSGPDWRLPPSAFSSTIQRFLLSSYFAADDVPAYFAFDEYLGRMQPTANPFPGSISLGFLDSLIAHAQEKKGTPTEEFPYGKPSNNLYFYYDNKTVFMNVAQTIEKLNQNSPFVGYFHLYSPHSPYAPHKDFVDIFEDIPLVKKPLHKLSSMRFPQRTLKEQRKRYDEYIANVDAEFGNLLDSLESSGVLDNSYLILASDHGELFERGEIGHGTALLFEPVIRTPLIISPPGQNHQVDVYSHTCNTDLIPTLLHISGAEIPESLDGKVLPGLGGTDDPERSIFSVQANQNSSFLPIKKATIALNKKNYKLIYYLGYEKYDQRFELYNLHDDPNELSDVFKTDTLVASQMQDELLTALDDANRPFRRN
jgi:arylsulfatase A-like enzyme